MKNINNYMKSILLLGLFAFVFTACEEDDSGELVNDALTTSTKVFLATDNITSISEAESILQSASGAELRSDAVVDVAVVRTGGSIDSEVTVSYTSTATYVSTTDFFNEGDDASGSVSFSNEGSIVIPAGQTRGTISIAISDDALATGDRAISITLTGTSAGELGLSGATPNTSQTITIIDDDCPIDIASWVGTYSVSENFTSGVNSPNGLSFFFGESYQIEMALDPNDATGTKVVITNSDGFNTFLNDGIVMSFLTCPGEVSFSDAPPLIAEWNRYDFEVSSYDEDKLTVKCEGPFLTFGPYQFTFTKIQE